MANRSIRERILVQRRSEMAAISGIGTVYRWDARGTSDPLDHLDGILRIVEETAEDMMPAYSNRPPDVECRMTIAYGVVIYQPEDASTATEILINQWRGLIEDAIHANPLVTETATSAQLAVDSTPQEVDGDEFEDGAVHACYREVIEYRTDGNDVSVHGTLVAGVSE